jgi:hypothetical protein
VPILSKSLAPTISFEKVRGEYHGNYNTSDVFHHANYVAEVRGEYLQIADKFLMLHIVHGDGTLSLSGTAMSHDQPQTELPFPFI